MQRRKMIDQKKTGIEAHEMGTKQRKRVMQNEKNSNNIFYP